MKSIQFKRLYTLCIKVLQYNKMIRSVALETQLLEFKSGSTYWLVTMSTQKSRPLFNIGSFRKIKRFREMYLNYILDIFLCATHRLPGGLKSFATYPQYCSQHASLSKRQQSTSILKSDYAPKLGRVPDLLCTSL